MVLAAGASSRLGEPKQLIVLNGETLLERAVRVAKEAGCDPVVVVLGANAERIQARCRLDDAKILVREDWSSGMGGSVAAGVAAVGDAEGCIVMTCDMPAVSVAHLRALAESGSGGEIVASSYAHRSGVPAYFPSSRFDELRNLGGDRGARALLEGVSGVELDGGDLDVDTAEDLERLRRQFQC